MNDAKRSGIAHRIVGLTRKELIRNGYPMKAVSKVKIDFASDEDIQNKTDGNYWKYFSMSEHERKPVIIGAGLAGLTTALCRWRRYR